MVGIIYLPISLRLNQKELVQITLNKITIDIMYSKISGAKKYYPNFYKWYYFNVVPNLLTGDKEFVFEIVNNKLVGVAIIKYSEKKLCHLSIFDEYKNRGYGLRLFEKVFEKLGTDKPFLTVSEEKYVEFEKIFKYYGFKLSEKRYEMYRKGKWEYLFNEDIVC